MARFKSKAQIAAEEQAEKEAAQETINTQDREQYLLNKFAQRKADGLSVPAEWEAKLKEKENNND